MFTGIIEQTGRISEVEQQLGNLLIWFSSPISDELKIDESISHNGVCLTVDAKKGGLHRVTVVSETLEKSQLGKSVVGDIVNLERSLMVSSRLDGHVVQGHVDTVAICLSKKETNGSHTYIFRFPAEFGDLVVEKGSICLNGISLTVFDVTSDTFAVAVIPYTYHHTNIALVNEGDAVNIEFDIFGKYVKRILRTK